MNDSAYKQAQQRVALGQMRVQQAHPEDLVPAVRELVSAIRAISKSDDLTPIRNEWMMKALTRCEIALPA